MKRIQQMFEKTVSQLQHHVEDLLMTPPSAEFSTQERPHFESLSTAKDFKEALRHLPEDPIDRTIILFSRLSSFFESGALLAYDQDFWVSVCAFNCGEYFIPPPHPGLHLPPLEKNQILKGNSSQLQKSLNFLKIPDSTTYTSLLLQPRPTLSFILFSNLADPWLKDQVREISQLLEQTL